MVATIATDGTGVGELLAAVGDHRRYLVASDSLSSLRRDRALREIEAAVRAGLRRKASLGPTAEAALERVVAREVDPWTVAEGIIDAR